MNTSQAKMSKILKVSRCTVQEVIKQNIETGDIKDRKRRRRQTKLTKRDCNYLRITSLRNRSKSCPELGSDLAQTSRTQVHSSIIRRELVKEGLHGRVAKRKPYLRQGNKQKRLEFAKEHKK